MNIKDKLFKFPNGLIWKINSKFSLRSRRAKFELFMNQLSPDDSSTILDVGAYGGEDWGSGKDYAPTNFLEKWYPFKKNITALGVDDLSGLKKIYPEISVMRYDGKIFPFADKKFEISFANAVIEHVGSRADQQLFLDEMIRVSEKVFLTTPNRWFFLEPHTLLPLLHWLPQNIFRRICKKIGLEYWSTEANLNLLSPILIRRMLKKHRNEKDVKIRWSVFSPSVIVIIK